MSTFGQPVVRSRTLSPSVYLSVWSSVYRGKPSRSNLLHTCSLAMIMDETISGRSVGCSQTPLLLADAPSVASHHWQSAPRTASTHYSTLSDSIAIRASCHYSQVDAVSSGPLPPTQHSARLHQHRNTFGPSSAAQAVIFFLGPAHSPLVVS